LNILAKRGVLNGSFLGRDENRIFEKIRKTVSQYIRLRMPQKRVFFVKKGPRSRKLAWEKNSGFSKKGPKKGVFEGVLERILTSLHRNYKSQKTQFFQPFPRNPY